MFVNPANISIRPDMAVGVNFRNQWQGIGTPFNSFNVHGYYPILSKDKYKQMGAIGGYIMSDNQPKSFYKTIGGAINGAYKLPINYANYMHFGIQLGFFQTGLVRDGLRSGSQYNGIGYDPSLAFNDNPGSSKGQPKIALGTTWVNEDINGDILASAGVAVYNINKPNKSVYTGQVDGLYRRIVVTGQVRAVKVNDVSVIPMVRLNFQSKAYHHQLGAMVRYGVNQGQRSGGYEGDGFFKAGFISGGLFYQYKQAVIGQIEFSQPRYALAFSYDFGLSDLKDGTTRANAPEIFITYKKTLGRKKKADIRYYKTKEAPSAPSAPLSDPDPVPAPAPAKPVEPKAETPAPAPAAPAIAPDAIPATVAPAPAAAKAPASVPSATKTAGIAKPRINTTAKPVTTAVKKPTGAQTKPAAKKPATPKAAVPKAKVQKK